MELQDTIRFQTEDGEKVIELLYGDITKLPLEDKVDLIMISAFRDDYTVTRASVVGALYRNLDILVYDLAQNKEQDLRKFFHCWWSKSLPQNVPYRRLLCFETSNSITKPQKAVQGIFKALVPATSLFTNGSIISPLLSTGHQDFVSLSQSFSSYQMMRALVEGAVTWMKNGWSINCFKLVIYKKDDKLSDIFATLKSKHGSVPVIPPPLAPAPLPLPGADGTPPAPPPLGPHGGPPAPPPPEANRGPPASPHPPGAKQKPLAPIQLSKKKKLARKATMPESSTKLQTYDFYLTFDSSDQLKAVEVRSLLEQQDKRGRLRFLQYNQSDVDEDNPEYFFEVFKKCARVVTFLSPNFLDNDDCMEQYNAAYCLSRSGQTELAPMYCQTIKEIPTYITLVQWIDVRIRDGTTDKMVKNIMMYVNGYMRSEYGLGSDDEGDEQAETTPAIQKNRDDKNPTLKIAVDNYEFDVFISYCHADEAAALEVIKQLRAAQPDIRLFVDRQELKTGTSWQQRIYQSLEKSHTVLALLTPAYLNSKMCNEEFRIALARHYTDPKFHLVPVQISAIPDLPEHFMTLRRLDVVTDVESYSQQTLAPSLVNFLKTNRGDGDLIPLSKRTRRLQQILSDGRNVKTVELVEQIPPRLEAFKKRQPVVQLLYCRSDPKDTTVASELRKKLVNLQVLNVVILNDGDSAAQNLEKLDKADLIVPLVSISFIRDEDRVRELQVAINRQRSTKDKKQLMYPILLSDDLEKAEKDYQLYYSLLTYETCLKDSVWTSADLEDAMKRNTRFALTILDCKGIQMDFDKVSVKLSKNGKEPSDEERRKKDEMIITERFTSLLCHRIVTLLQARESSTEVIINIFTLMKLAAESRQDADYEMNNIAEMLEEKYSTLSHTEDRTMQAEREEGSEQQAKNRTKLATEAQANADGTPTSGKQAEARTASLQGNQSKSVRLSTQGNIQGAKACLIL